MVSGVGVAGRNQAPLLGRCCWQQNDFEANRLVRTPESNPSPDHPCTSAYAIMGNLVCLPGVASVEQRFPSWRAGIADNGHGAKRPENLFFDVSVYAFADPEGAVAGDKDCVSSRVFRSCARGQGIGHFDPRTGIFSHVGARSLPGTWRRSSNDSDYRGDRDGGERSRQAIVCPRRTGARGHTRSAESGRAIGSRTCSSSKATSRMSIRCAGRAPAWTERSC